MILANYINDLLYRHNCVIVPNFGGFVTNTIGAKINENTNTFYPPSKQITFNVHLMNNDGLLANYIAKSENISFEKANQQIAKTVNFWNKELKLNSICIGKIGRLQLNKENQIIFEPLNTTNYLTSSFGLASYKSETVIRKAEKVIPIQTAVAKKSVAPTFIKYAAAAILLTVGFFGYQNYQEGEQQKRLTSQKQALDKKIEEATFVISNPLPTIELNVTKEKPKPFHIMAGSFQFPENADKKVAQLKEQGYNARVLGINKWGLFQVAFESFSNRKKAFSSLYNIRKNVSKDAWILIKTFK